MTARKPVLPEPSHLAVATRIAAAVADVDPASVAALPADIRKALSYLDEVSEVAARISIEQPSVLADFRDDLIDLADEALTSSEGAGAVEVVDALLESMTVARLLASVEAGEISAIASLPGAKRRKPRTPRKPPAEQPSEQPSPAKPSEQPAEQVAVQDVREPEPVVDAAEPDAPVAPPMGEGLRNLWEPDGAEDF